MDEPNRLHFYVVDLRRDQSGILVYKLAVRSLDGAGPRTRGVTLAVSSRPKVKGPDTPVGFTLKNTGQPGGPAEYFESDVYRLSATVEGKGWSIRLLNGLAAVRAGASAPVTVYVSCEAGASKTASVTLRAVSESDPGQAASAGVKLTR